MQNSTNLSYLPDIFSHIFRLIDDNPETLFIIFMINREIQRFHKDLYFCKSSHDQEIVEFL